MQQPTRERTITWEDPATTFERARHLSGMDYLRGIMSGELPAPPIARMLGMDIVELGEGRAVLAAQPGEHHYNPIGVVHGGLAATLLDSATGCAVQTTLGPGTGYTTIELNTHFTGAITRDTGRVLCEAEVVHRGGTIATAEGRLRAESTGKMLAHGTSTCLIIPAAVGRTSGKGNGNGSTP